MTLRKVDRGCLQIVIVFALVARLGSAQAQVKKEAETPASTNSTLRNEDIIKLAKAGIDDAVIIAKIASLNATLTLRRTLSSC